MITQTWTEIRTHVAMKFGLLEAYLANACTYQVIAHCLKIEQ